MPHSHKAKKNKENFVLERVGVGFGRGRQDEGGGCRAAGPCMFAVKILLQGVTGRITEGNPKANPMKSFPQKFVFLDEGSLNLKAVK